MALHEALGYRDWERALLLLGEGGPVSPAWKALNHTSNTPYKTLLYNIMQSVRVM